MINREEALSIYLKSKNIEETVSELLEVNFEPLILESAKTQRFTQVSLKHNGLLQYYSIGDFNDICRKLKSNLEDLGYKVHLRSLDNLNTNVVFDILF